MTIDDSALKASRRNAVVAFAVVAFAVIALALLASAFGYYRHGNAQMRQEKYAFLESIGKLKAGQVERWRKERSDDARRLARGVYLEQVITEFLADPVRSTHRAGLIERLHLDQIEGGYHDILLLAADSRLLLTTETTPAALHPATQRALAAALASQGAVMSDLFSEPDGPVHIDAVAAVRDAEQNPVAAVVLRSDVSDYLYPLIHSRPTESRTAETLLVQRDGETVVFLAESRHRANTVVSLHVPPARTDVPAVQAVLGRQGRFEGNDYRGVAVLSDVRPIHGSPWFVVSKMDTSEILAELHSRARVIAGIAGSLILLAAALAACIDRRWQARRFRDLYQSERRRRETEEVFRVTLYSIGDAVITTDTKGAVRAMNPVAEKLTGWTEADARGKPSDKIFFILHEDTRQPSANPVDVVLREGRVVALANHVLLISRDGSEHPIAHSAAPIRVESGAITGVVLVFSDQTGPHVARKAIRESEERLRLALAAANQGLYDLNVQTGECVVTPEYPRMLDYDPDNFVETNAAWRERLHPDDLEPIYRIYQEYVAGQRDEYRIEFRLRTRTGQWKWILSLGKLVSRSADGRPLRMLGTHTDITERKQAEEVLRHSEERFRNLVQSVASVAVQGYGPDGTTQYWNHGSEQIYGYTAEEAIGRNLLDLIIPPEMREGVKQAIEQMAQTGHAIPASELSLMRKDGTRVTVFSSHATLHIPGCKPELFCFDIDLTEQKRGEQRISEALSYNQTILDHSPAGIINYTSEGDAVSANAAAARILGATVEQLVSQNFRKIESWQRSGLLAAAERTLQNGQEQALKAHMVTTFGKEVWLACQFAPFSHDGRRQLMLTFLDITESKRAEEALRENELLIRAVMDHLPIGVAMNSVEPPVRFTYTNDRFIQCYRTTREALAAPDAFWEAVYEEPDFREQIKKRVLDDCASNDPGRMHWEDVPITRRGAGTTFISAMNTPVPGKRLMISTVWDVTDRKRIERRLHLQGSALEAAATAILITDREGVIEWANAAFTTLTGYSMAETIGQKPGPLLKSGNHEPAFYRNLWETILARNVWRGEIINRRKDGALYTEEMTITPLKSESGQITHFIAVKQDITKRKALEEQFRQSQKMEAIGRLAGGVAHDFNNILGVIQGHTSLVQMGLAPDEQRNSLREIARASERAANLTRQLLTFSRRQVMQAKDLDLNDVIIGMVKMLHRIIGEDIRMQTQLLPGGAPVHGDPGMLEQVLLNFAVNARDAMPEGGQIAMELAKISLDDAAATRPYARPGEFVRLSFRDTGCGIPPEHLPRIFEPFFTTKDVGKGTGLGLATVHGIVEQHQGWIEVESRPGHGTAFHVHLPRLTNSPPTLAAIRPAAPVRGGSETILVVEDESALRSLAIRVLERYGYSVLEASSGVAALELWRQHGHSVDLLLTDIIMPEGVSGRQLAEELQAERPALKVIYMSGHPGEVVGPGLNLQEGVNFLAKPFTTLSLAQAVRDRLNAKQKGTA